MPPAARRLIGLLTVILLVAIGFPLLKARPIVGAVVLGLAVFRAVVLVQEVRARRRADAQTGSEAGSDADSWP